MFVFMLTMYKQKNPLMYKQAIPINKHEQNILKASWSLSRILFLFMYF